VRNKHAPIGPWRNDGDRKLRRREKSGERSLALANESIGCDSDFISFPAQIPGTDLPRAG